MVVAAFLAAFPGAAPAADVRSGAGRLERVGASGTCSATLVAPDMAVTAAHCVNPERLRTGNAPQVFFRPAAPAGAAPLAVVAAVRHPLYAPGRGSEQVWRFPFDLAVVRLVRGLPTRVNPALPDGPPPEVGERLTLVTWRGSDEEPVVRVCPVIPGAPGMITLGCPVQGGESGGAVLRLSGGRAEIVAVLTSRRQIGALPVAQASPLELRLEPMLRLID